jgi:hypothetical protein
MTEPKFTPGPWKWEQKGNGSWELISPSGPVHSDGSAAGEYDPTIDVHGPDAHLIAASPDMYEALNACLHYIEGSMTVKNQVKAAIAKAKGL